MNKVKLSRSFTILFVAILCLLSLTVLNVKANPFIPKGSVAQDPSPPSIEVQSPTPEQRLNPTNDVWLKFKVTVPKTSWGSIGTTFGSITSVSYILDSMQEQNLNLNKAEYGVLSYSINLGQLSGGKYTLKIIAEGSGYYGIATHDLYAGSKPSFKEVMQTKSLNNSVQYNFWVEGSSNIIISSPTEELNLPNLSMPKEHINYTITNKNGSYWVKIQGKYPIKILNSNTPEINFPMIYPTPPNTTNIHITLNGKELNWSNYTQTYPETLHHTAIGDWTMIQCLIENVKDAFLLEIQYEHPIQQLKGIYTFLYDLNINPYLSDQSPKSIAYFTINFETTISDLQIFTTKTDSNWNPLNFTTQTNEPNTIIATQIESKYLEPLLGDLVVSFNTPVSGEISGFLLTASPAIVILAVVILGLVVNLAKKRKKPR